METRCPVEEPFVSEFSRSLIIAELWRPQSRKTWKFCAQFCIFLYGKIFEILFQKFSPPHRSTLLCRNVVKSFWLEIGELCDIYRTKNGSLTGSPTVAAARIAPKICKDQSPTFGSHCSRFYPNRFSVGGWCKKIFFLWTSCAHLKYFTKIGIVDVLLTSSKHFWISLISRPNWLESVIDLFMKWLHYHYHNHAHIYIAPLRGGFRGAGEESIRRYKSRC